MTPIETTDSGIYHLSWQWIQIDSYSDLFSNVGRIWTPILIDGYHIHVMAIVRFAPYVYQIAHVHYRNCLMVNFVLQWMWTHWGRVTHICVNKVTIIDSDNDLTPGRRPVIIWTNTAMLTLGPQGSYSIFQNQGTPFSPCLADATRRLVLPGVASACLALRCLARQDKPRPMPSAGSDIWLLTQVL